MNFKLILKRIGAYFIDYLIISLITMALVHLSFLNPKYDEYMEANDKYMSLAQDYYDKKIDAQELSEKTKGLSYDLNKNGYVYIIGDIVVAFLYFGAFAYWTKGQNLGKKVFNIKIVSAKNKKLGLHNYLIRTFILNGIILDLFTLVSILFKEKTYLTIYTIGSEISSCITILIFLMIMFNKQGRGLHDMLAGTRVISVKNEEEIETEEKKDMEVIKPKKNKKENK